MEGFVQYGSWILIDPDERHIDLIEETIDLENLCDLLRCDSTDLLNLGDSYLGFVDGEGAWQERQTEWEFDGKSCWGPMLIFIMGNDDLDMLSCSIDSRSMGILAGDTSGTNAGKPVLVV